MPDDIFDTRYEGKEIKLDDNLARAGDEINLSQKDPALQNILIGVGWDVNAFDADVLDLDVSLLLLDKNNMTRVDEDFVFYNAPETLDGAVKHNGDSRTGAGDGDDESISINLHGLPFEIVRLLFVISIYKGEEKEQRISQLRNGYLRVVNNDTGHEIVRYELDDDIDDHEETAMIVAEINREGPKWHFKPLAQFTYGGLGAVASRHGMIITQQ